MARSAGRAQGDKGLTRRYDLTEMGQSFREPVSALGHWALENLATIDAAREAYDRKHGIPDAGDTGD